MTQAPSDAKTVPQEILDALTRVDMPAIPAITADQIASETITVGNHSVRVLRTGALVLGGGAAGLRAAVEMQRRGTPALIASMSPFGGTSACSGSDKQTLHTAGTGNQGDDFNELAEALSAGGGMDADTAYSEAVGSITAFAGLQYTLACPCRRIALVRCCATKPTTMKRAGRPHAVHAPPG